MIVTTYEKYSEVTRMILDNYKQLAAIVCIEAKDEKILNSFKVPYHCSRFSDYQSSTLEQEMLLRGEEMVKLGMENGVSAAWRATVVRVLLQHYCSSIK